MKPNPASLRSIHTCAWVRLASALAASAFLAGVQPIHAEGFGISKTAVYLERHSSPPVQLMHPRYQVTATGRQESSSLLVEDLRSRVVAGMAESGIGLRLDPIRPQLLVEIEVVDNIYKESFEEKPSGTRLRILEHRVDIAYTARDLTTRTSLDSETFEITYEDRFRDGDDFPSQTELEADAIEEAAERVLARLVPRPETMPALLPKGSLRHLIPLAEGGLWNQYQEALDALSASEDLELEAYRQYALGLSFEALGYGITEAETTARYLEEAAVHYRKALSLHPAEKYFSRPYEASGFGRATKWVRSKVGKGENIPRMSPPPLERVLDALAACRTLQITRETLAVAIKEVDEEATATGARSASSSGEADSPANGAGDILRNSEILAMTRSGMPEDIILTAIRTSTCDFDLSAPALIELYEAKVSAEVIRTMQENQPED